MPDFDLAYNPGAATQNRFVWLQPTDDSVRWNVGNGSTSGTAEYDDGLVGNAYLQYASPSVGTLPNDLSATYRLELVGANSPGTGSVEGTLSFGTLLNGDSWLRVGTPADMRAAFGTGNRIRTGGGTWRLSEIVDNPLPSSDNRWVLITPVTWNANSGYPISTYTVRNSNLYISINTINVPTTYTQIFDFAAGGSTSTTPNVVDYLDNLAAFRGGVCLNNAHDSLVPTTGTFRIRRASGTTAETTGVTGTITKQSAPFGGSGYFCFRVGTIAEMQAAFGTNVNITTGANWIFERVNAGTNTAPENDPTNWSQVVVTVWDGTSAYLQNAVVSQGSPIAYYRANSNIPVPTGGENNPRLGRRNNNWVFPRLNTLIDGDRVLFYDNDVGETGLRFRTLGAVPQNLETEAGQNLETEAGETLQTEG